MNRRGFLIGLLSSAAFVAVTTGAAVAQAVHCYDPAGRRVPCRRRPLARGVVRRARRRRRRRVRRTVRRARRRVRRRR